MHCTWCDVPNIRIILWILPWFQLYCLNYKDLVFSFVLVSHYQVVHGLWRCEILIRGVEWRGGAREGGGRGRGKHRITGGHGAMTPVILHEVVQVGAGAGQVAATYLLLLLKERFRIFLSQIIWTSRKHSNSTIWYIWTLFKDQMCLVFNIHYIFKKGIYLVSVFGQIWLFVTTLSLEHFAKENKLNLSRKEVNLLVQNLNKFLVCVKI